MNPFRYRGYVIDTESGLYYLRSRYYSPQINRFISSDRIIDSYKGVASSNIWCYCHNSPLIYTDFKGTDSWLINTFEYFLKTYSISITMYIEALKNKVVDTKKNFSNTDFGKTINEAVKNSSVTKEIYSSLAIDVLTRDEMEGKIQETVYWDAKISDPSYNDYDRDLSFSIGHIYLTMVVTWKGLEDREGKVFHLFSVSYSMSDRYDFHLLPGDTQVDRINNFFGYDFQEKGILTPYNWEMSGEFDISIAP